MRYAREAEPPVAAPSQQIRLGAGPPATVRRVTAAIDAIWLGRVDYRDAWGLQKRLVEARAAGPIGGPLLLLGPPAAGPFGVHSRPWGTPLSSRWDGRRTSVTCSLPEPSSPRAISRSSA